MSDRLSSEAHWSERWSNQDIEEVERGFKFDVNRFEWRAVDRFIREHLPNDPSARAIEIGCYPGRYMWYLHEHFGYTVDGVEYVDWCAEITGELLKRNNVPGEVRHADLFTLDLDPADRYDVVVSFGFIEHFEDTTGVVQRHLDLLKPGGRLLLVIPNHSGFNGHLMKRVDPKVHAIHNLMTYADMERGVLNTGQADVVAGGYLGGLALTNTMLYTRAKLRSQRAFLVTRGLGYTLERTLGRIIPDTQFFSPVAALVAQKRPD